MTTQLTGVASALILSPWMSVEHLDDTSATIYLSLDGTRIRIPLSLHRLLLRFTAATDPDDVCGTSGPQSTAARAIAQLTGKGFLVSADAVPAFLARQVSDPPVRLFDVPAQKLLSAQADVVVLGMPWDFGALESVGARRGPLALRDVSLQILYGLDRLTGRPRGWFDADRKRSMLTGISIADAGDVIVNHGESRSSAFGRARDVLATLTRDGALPVLIGGDASTAATVIEVMQRSGPLDVIRIGRPAYGPQTGTVNLLTAASLPAHVLSMPFVGRYVHVVPRGSEMAGMKLPGKYARISVDAALAMDKGPLDQGGNDRRRVHVGIDVDALAQASDGASCASFAYRDVHALLGAIGRTCRIASIDLCGVNPSAPCWGAVSMTGLHLLLTALSAAKDPA